MKGRRRLVVNADDFGFSRDVNEGIVQAHRDGILTATTLMANGGAFDHAVALAAANPSLDVGCHLVLTGGRSLAPPFLPYPESVPKLIAAMMRGRVRIYDELKAQVGRIVAAGIEPTHLDTHKHTHLLPPVLEAVARLSAEFGIPWVRRPFDFPMHPAAGAAPFLTRAVNRGFGVVRSRFHRALMERGCRTTDHFAGFQMTGRFGAGELSGLLRSLPEGTTEFMCHPGLCTAELRGMRTRLKESRELELRALTSPEVRETLWARDIQLLTYRDL